MGLKDKKWREVRENNNNKKNKNKNTNNIHWFGKYRHFWGEGANKTDIT